jgi:hypothetical protein
MLLIKLEKSILIFRESEEIVLLRKMLELFVRMIGTDEFPIFFYEIALLLKGFTSDTVETIIDSFIDISVIIGFLEYLLDKLDVSWFSRTDKISIPYISTIPYFSMLCCHHIRIRHRLHTECFCGFEYFLGVLIDSGRKFYLIPLKLLISSDSIRKK